MTLPDEPDMTAAELALGVLEGEERAAALRRRLSDPAFAREVERWRERLGGFFAGWPEVEPSAAAERRILSAVWARPVADRRWKWVAAIASVAAVLLLAISIGQLVHAPEPARPLARASSLVAVVKPSDGDPIAIAIDPATRLIRVGGRIATRAGQVAELWVIGRDGVPHAAGLLAGAGRPAIPRNLPLAPGTTLAISIEPVGGSPKPTPTGPVIGTGTLARI